MKINHYNTYPYGGAANAAKRIHDGLCEQGQDSSFYYRIDNRQTNEVLNDPRLFQIQYQTQAQAKTRGFDLLGPIRKRAEKKRVQQIHRLYDFHIRPRTNSEHEVYSMARLPETTQLDWVGKHKSDIVHLHWLAHMVDFTSFFDSIPNEVPIVWTMHDMGAITGGCHYSDDCMAFESGCGNCPQVANSNARDVSYDSMQAKQKSLHGKKLHIVAPSKWLIELAKRSVVWPAETTFSVLHYGLDLELFQPQDQTAVRQRLGIETKKTVIGFGADDLSNRRKGFGFLCDALKQLTGNTPGQLPIELVVFGEGEIPDDLQDQFQTHSFGYVREPSRLADVYACCDMVVVPSLQDNQPQVGLEAMACGRPVVGFDAGGIPEYTIDGETGRLAPARDTDALSTAIRWMVDNPQAVCDFGRQAREKMEKEFEVTRQTRAYVELYRSLVNLSCVKNSMCKAS